MARKTRTLRFTADNTVAGAFSFDIPGGCTRFRARLMGGGGGGGSGARANTNGGNGGAGGGGARITEFDVLTTPGTTWSGQLGAGGAGGPGQGNLGNNPLSSSGGDGAATTLTDGIQVLSGAGANGGVFGWAPGDNRPSLGGLPLSNQATSGGGVSAATLANPAGIYPPMSGQGGNSYMETSSDSYPGWKKGMNTPQSTSGLAGTGSDFTTTQGKGGAGGGASEWQYDSIDNGPGVKGRTGGNGANYLLANGTGNSGQAGQYGGGGGGGGGGRNAGGTNAGGDGAAGGMGCVEIILEL